MSVCGGGRGEDQRGDECISVKKQTESQRNIAEKSLDGVVCRCGSFILCFSPVAVAVCTFSCVNLHPRLCQLLPKATLCG